MITVIRKKFKSTVYKSVLWITILAVIGVFSLPEIIKMATKSDQWVIRINRSVIDNKEFIQALKGQQWLVETIKSYYGPQAELLAQISGFSLDPLALTKERLIRISLLDNAASQCVWALDESYLVRKMNQPEFLIQSLPEFVPMNGFDKDGLSQARLKDHLQKNGISMAEFERAVERVGRCDMLMGLVGTTVYVSQQEIRQRIQEEFGKKKFSYITATLDTFLKQVKNQEPSSEEVKHFFNTRTAQGAYWIPEQRTGTVWSFDASTYGITVSSQAIERYYHMNKTRKFLAKPLQVQVRMRSYPTFEEAALARQELVKQPEIFAQGAQELPLFGKGDKAADVERAIFLIEKEGDISQIVNTDQGFTLFQLIARHAPQYKELATVQSEIADTLLKEQFAQRFVPEAQAAYNAGQQRWKEFVNSHRGTVKKIEKASLDNTQLGLRALFKASQEKYAAAIEGTAGSVAYVEAISMRHLPSLESVYSQVKDEWYTAQAQLAMQKALKEALSVTLDQGIEAAAKVLQVPVQMTPLIAKNDPASLQDLKKKGFALKEALSLEVVGSAIENITPKEGSIVQLKERVLPDESIYAAHALEVEKLLQQEQTNSTQRGFVASLYRHATIETNKSFLQEIEKRMSL
jgi:hypothetical protein